MTNMLAFALNKVKNMNLQVFNLISKVNEARLLVQHKLCERRCRLNKVYVIQSMET